MFYKGKTKAAAFTFAVAARIGLIETFKDTGLFVFRNADTFVGDADNGKAFFGANINNNMIIQVFAELNSIVKEIDKHFFNQLRGEK